MTMSGARLRGNVDKDKILRRFENVLQLVYMNCLPTKDGSYKIPKKVFESVQTELDFNPPSENVEEQIKKRYRKRETYRFWKEFLWASKIGNQIDAKEYLMKIYTLCDNKGVYGSMTHSRYALETMTLALDDLYGTNETIISQTPFRVNKKKVIIPIVGGQGIVYKKKETEQDDPADQVPF